VNGDIRCCHGGVQTFIPRRGLSAPAQAEPVSGRKTINCVDVVIPASLRAEDMDATVSAVVSARPRR